MHEYDYDLLGRQTADRVSQVGLGIDDAVRCLGLSYEVRGMVKNVTSYSTPAVDEDFVVNEVRNDYRDFMQNAGQDQEHNGKVVLGTTLRTIYDYEDGSHNTARFKRYSLPDELGTFSYNYGDVDGIGDRLSRPIATSAQYGFQYLGLSSLLETRIYRGQAIRWSVILGSDAANPYGGLDRFGRVIDNLWNLPDLSTTLDRIQYGYDRVGNRVWRYNVVAHTHSAAFDEPYSYDGLNQLTDMQRGSYSTAPVLPNTAPSGFSSTPTLQQTWSLDSTGNWSDFTEALSGSTTLDQAREANRVNEITEITNSTGGGWQQPVYDAAGNMTLMPQPASPGDGFAAVYDAWNRLVRIDDVSGESPVTVQANAYDGLTRRVSKTTFGDAGEIRHYYYDLQWRVIEEYVGESPTRANREDWDRQNLWGLRYIDELVTQLRAVPSSAPTPYIPLQDANFNVTALCAGNGTILERYAYTAYGTPTFQDDTFTTLSPNQSAYNWETLYCGYRFDAETGLYHVRFRVLHPTLGKWVSRDPVYTADGSLFAYTGNSPFTFCDPSGLFSWSAFGIGLVKGIVTGVVVSVVLVAAVAALPATAGAVLVYGAAAAGTALLANEAVTLARGRETFSSRELSEEERSERLGSLIGGVAGGYAAGRVGTAFVYNNGLAVEGSLLSPARLPAGVSVPRTGTVPKALVENAGNRFEMPLVRQRILGGRATPVRTNPAVARGIERLQLSHWTLTQQGVQTGRYPAWLVNRPWNLRLLWQSDHAMVDSAAYRFMGPSFKALNSPLNPAAGFLSGAPYWFQGALSGTTGGGVAPLLTNSSANDVAGDDGCSPLDIRPIVVEDQ